ncbi:MAG: hypothetical protein VCB63_13200, partial [Alphaproteobacteria bacterium]
PDDDVVILRSFIHDTHLIFTFFRPRRSYNMANPLENRKFDTGWIHENARKSWEKGFNTALIDR